MRRIILLCFLIFPIILQAQNSSFTVDQLGLPLKEVINNFKKEKNLEPTYISDYGSVEYWNMRFANRKTRLIVDSFDSCVYRFNYSFFPEDSSTEEYNTILFTEMLKELTERYGAPQYTDPYHLYGLGKDYLKVAHWNTKYNVIKLHQDYDSDLVALTYTFTPVFEKYIKNLLDERAIKKHEALKDY